MGRTGGETLFQRILVKIVEIRVCQIQLLSLFFFAVFILVAVVGGILFGVVVLLLVYHARGRCKREKKPERTVPRVSFKIPPPKLEAFAITTQTRYPQQEQEGLEEYLDPEIYRYYEYRIFDTNDQRQQDRTPLTSRIKDSGVETGFT